MIQLDTCVSECVMPSVPRPAALRTAPAAPWPRPVLPRLPRTAPAALAALAWPGLALPGCTNTLCFCSLNSRVLVAHTQCELLRSKGEQVQS